MQQLSVSSFGLKLVSILKGNSGEEDRTKSLLFVKCSQGYPYEDSGTVSVNHGGNSETTTYAVTC